LLSHCRIVTDYSFSYNSLYRFSSPMSRAVTTAGGRRRASVASAARPSTISSLSTGVNRKRRIPACLRNDWIGPEGEPEGDELAADLSPSMRREVAGYSGNGDTAILIGKQSKNSWAKENAADWIGCDLPKEYVAFALSFAHLV
jgi:hypothetical protein